MTVHQKDMVGIQGIIQLKDWVKVTVRLPDY
jgi:hypothetical protein